MLIARGGEDIMIELEWLSDAIRSLPFAGKECISPVPYLSVFRSFSDNIEMPASDALYIYIVVKGAVRLHTPSGIMDYTEGQLFVASYDAPFSGEILEHSACGDFLGAAVCFTVEEVFSVVLSLDERVTEDILDGKAQMDGAEKYIAENLTRLLRFLGERNVRAFISGAIKREIIFFTLLSSYGRQVLQSAVKVSQEGEMYEVNTWIKHNFQSDFSVEELAKQQHMSVSSFHQKFKNAVGMGRCSVRKNYGLQRQGGKC